MARIRTIKPEFWEDEKIGALSHGARLLFLCCLNLSDDEGLLRWNTYYLASNAFTYDEIKIDTIEKWMKELVDNELIYVYQAGMVKQQIGYIINFHKHQRIDKPQPGKFPPPNYKDARVKDMIYKRDKGVCKLCGNLISEPPKYAPYLEENSRKRMMSCDHIKPRSKGGTDYFSNLQASHLYCNQCKCDKYNEQCVDNEDYTEEYMYSKNDSKNDSWMEKEKEKEKEKEEKRDTDVSPEKSDSINSVIPENGGTHPPVAPPPLPDPEFLEFQKWVLKKAPRVAELKEPFTQEEYLRIRKEFPPPLTAEVLMAMHNCKDLLKKYVSANLTFRNWINRRLKDGTNIGSKVHEVVTDPATGDFSDDI